MAETWARLRTIFEGALEQKDSERAAWLEEACGGDQAVRSAVEELLRIDREAGTFLDEPLLPERPGPQRPPVERRADSLRDLLADSDRGRGGSGRVRVPEAVPDRLGPYRILRRIGQGGLGVVYLAVRDDDTFQRRVVVKLVRQDVESTELQRRLRTERQILAGLKHPHIAELYDGGTTDDHRPYFVMEYIDGVPLDSYCDQHSLSVDERLELFSKVCSAVHYAHQNLVVHRDLKPSNILVTAAGEPKLLDFGIAKLLNPELASPDLEQTATWLRLMTPHYASPEQVRGKLVGTASDIYSLGVLLYLLLTGRLPHRFEARSPAEIERILTETDPLRPSTAVSGTASGTHSGTTPAPRSENQSSSLDASSAPNRDSVDSAPGSRGPEPRSAPADALSAKPVSSKPVSSESSTSKSSSSKSAATKLPSTGTDARTLSRQLSGDLDAIVMKALRTAPQRRYASAERFADDIDRYRRGLPVEARQGDWRYRATKFLRRHRLAVAMATTIATLVLTAGALILRQSAKVAAERDRAQLERGRKEVVLQTMLDVLKVADPYSEGGEDWTVREALESSEGRLRHRLREEPDLLAEVLQTTSQIYLNLGLWQRAREQGEEALRLRRGLHGAQDPSVAESESSLALALAELGEIERAAELSAAAVGRLRALESGLPESALVEALNNRVTVLCYAGDYEQAEQPSIEALDLARSAQGLESLSDALANRATLRLKAEDFDGAAELYRESLGVMEVLVEENHPSLAGILNNLGSSLRRSGRLGEAKEAFTRSFEIQQVALGEQHPNLAFALNNLGRVQLQSGDPAGAAEHYRAAIELLARQAEDNPRIFFLELNLASARIEAGEKEEVRAHMERILPLWTQRLGADHAWIADGQAVLSDLAEPE